MSKIIVVVDSIDVNESSGSKANVALISNFVKSGFKVQVYHYTRKNIELEGTKCIAIKEKKINILYVLSRTQRVIQRIFKINLAKYIEPVFGFSFTFFNDVNSIKKALKRIDLSEKDLILTLSQAASFRPHYAVNKLTEAYGKWMAYIHDPYPFSKYPEPYNWNEPGHKIKERFFKEISKNAKYSVFPSLLLKNWIGNHFPDFFKTGGVIPHQIIKIKPRVVDLPDFFDETKFNVLHAGSLMKQRNPSGLLKGFEKFLKDVPEANNKAVLILMGSATNHKDVLGRYSKKLPQVKVCLSSIPFEDMLSLQSQVAANVILEANSEMSPFLPGKFPHCVSANKPIIHLGPDKSETKRLLGENYPYAAQIEDVEAISNFFIKLYKEWLENEKKVTLNRKDLEYYLSEKNLRNQLEAILGND